MLVANPIAELASLRNGSLFSGKSIAITPGELFTPALPTGTGDTIDVVASVSLPAGGGGSGFGVAVLADPHGLHLAFAVRVAVSALSGTGRRTGTVNASVDGLPPINDHGPCVSSLGLDLDSVCASSYAGTWACPSCVTPIPNAPPPPPSPPPPRATTDTTGACCGQARPVGGALTLALWALRRCLLIGSYPIGWNATFDLVRGEDELDVRVVVDRSVVEIFVAGGRVAGLMATRTPNATLATAVHVFAPAGALVASLDIWSMGCGWNKTSHSR